MSSCKVPQKIAYILNTYITSLSEKRDDLTMWRLYGDDTKGVSIEYIAQHLYPMIFYLPTHQLKSTKISAFYGFNRYTAHFRKYFESK